MGEALETFSKQDFTNIFESIPFRKNRSPQEIESGPSADQVWKLLTKSNSYCELNKCHAHAKPNYKDFHVVKTANADGKRRELDEIADEIIGHYQKDKQAWYPQKNGE